LHPTSYFSGFKGSSGSGRFTSHISRVGLGISSYVGLNISKDCSSVLALEITVEE